MSLLAAIAYLDRFLNYARMHLLLSRQVFFVTPVNGNHFYDPVTHRELISLVAALVTITTGVALFLKFGLSRIGNLWRLLTRRLRIPRETVRALPVSTLFGRRNRWDNRQSGDRDVRRIVSALNVTNVTDQVEVRIVSAFLNDTEGILLGNELQAAGSGGFIIQPGRTEELEIIFDLELIPGKVSRDLKARIILLDQFGNRHKTPKIVFKGPQS